MINCIQRYTFSCLIALFLACTGQAIAAGGSSVPLDKVRINLGDQVGLQNGAKLFVNYCLNCHSANYMRYNRLTDLGLTEADIRNNFMFDKNAKLGDTMGTALAVQDAKDWFGGAPPDLTLVARVRGADWLYSYMRGFYRDDAAASGWNNRVFAGVSMPHVLSHMQGTQQAVYVEKDSHGKPVRELARLDIVQAGGMTSLQYDEAMTNLVNYMVYMGEPARKYRSTIGVVVLLFLSFMLILAMWLKHEYWKDVK
jgi:ubiquinol-cytochrome c reductase cytochrome c1 subunit